ncbi:hypothetical protein Leryth_010822 [Lithospermum erythrorhizon]|nr:hypothetical protein Leryth_010822 [Lithospermum erythrorhizon]
MGIIGQDDPILPVLIVGAGPVGLTLAFLLTKLGVKCAVLEKSKEFSKHPQAHVVNYRTMEVFRKMDNFAADILKSQPPIDQWKNFIYCTSITGRVIGIVDQLRSEDFDESASPITMSHFSQYKLVTLLLDKLNNLGFKIKHSESNQDQNEQLIRHNELLMGYKCISVNPTDHGVTITASFDNKEGISIKKDIQCKYLVAADGARSAIRDMVGINLVGLKNLQPQVSVHFFSRELGKFLVNDRPGMIYMLLNCKGTGLVAHNLEEGEFVMQMPYFPPQQTLEDFRSEMGKMLLTEFIGRELEDLQIVGVKPWFMNAQVAEKYLTSDNRVILVGDAAHRFPPTGGFGMNTGIQDAHNLAWKLAYVMQGIAPQSFLSTYEDERKQVLL